MPRLTRSRAILAALCASYAAYCLATRPPGPITAPDSQTYLSFSPIVPIGYPVFLKLTGARGATIAQPLIFAAALAFLGCEALLATSSLEIATAVVVGSIAIPDLTTYHASILTESLFMSMLVAFLASMVRFVRAPSAGAAMSAATAAGLSATLRSTGYAFLPVLIVMVALQRRQAAAPKRGSAKAPGTILLAATLPMLMLSGGERVAARVIHGDRLSSLMGRHLFAKAALVDAAPAAITYHAVPDILDAQLGITYAPIRGFIANAPRDTRATLTVYYETCLQGPCVAQLGESRAGDEDPRLADALALAARERLARAPLAFVRVVATDYAALWTPFKRRHPETVMLLNAWIASSRPLPFERQAFRVRPDASLSFEPSAAARVSQPIVLAVAWLTGGLALFGLVAAVTRHPLPNALTIACLTALTAHAGLLFSAIFGAGIGRFLISLWPAIASATVFAAAALFRFAIAGSRSVAV